MFDGPGVGSDAEDRPVALSCGVVDRCDNKLDTGEVHLFVVSFDVGVGVVVLDLFGEDLGVQDPCAAVVSSFRPPYPVVGVVLGCEVLEVGVDVVVCESQVRVC